MTGMIEAAARLREETRPRVKIALKIEYTRQVTRFGCSEVRTFSGAILWRNGVTGAVTKSRPRYNITLLFYLMFVRVAKLNENK